MSKQIPRRTRKVDASRAANLFAALGDETRLRLLLKLRAGVPQSITQLTIGLPVTRQAVTKHLRILEDAKFISQHANGRERLFTARPAAVDEAQTALDLITSQWSDALNRLKDFVQRPE